VDFALFDVQTREDRGFGEDVAGEQDALTAHAN